MRARMSTGRLAGRGPRRRRRRGLGTVVLVLGAGSQLGWSCEAGCEQPYRPVGTQYRHVGADPVGDWPVTGELRPPVLPAFDTDGDGVTDTQSLSADERALTIGRSSGDLVLTVPEPFRIIPFAAMTADGDLDGDDRADLIVSVRDSLGDLSHHVVPGATPAGSHALLDGFASPFAGTEDIVQLQVIGDLDGDGRDDVVAEEYVGGVTPRTLVWLAADVPVAPGSPPVPASRDLPTGLAGVVGLEGRNALLLQEEEEFPTDVVRVSLWLPEAELRFTTEGSEPLRVMPSAYAEVYQDEDQSWLVLTASTRDATQVWAFDLDDLCAGAPDIDGVTGTP
jgi:hypothetical protein